MKRLNHAMAVAALSLASSAPSHADTYHISSSAGNDTTGTGTAASPWKTFSRATPGLAAGDTLVVAAGTYAEQVKISTAGTPGAPVTIKAAPGPKPVIAGAGLPLEDQGLVELTGSHITFDGFEVADSAGYGIAVTGSDVTVQNCAPHGSFRYAIRYAYATGVVQGNEVYDNVRANAALIELGAGCVLIQGSTGVVVQKNTIYENYGFGISIVESAKIVARQNVLYDNVAYNISSINSTDVTISGNFAYCTGNPLFAESGDPPLGINLEGVISTGTAAPTTIVTNNIISGCDQGLIWGKVESTDGMHGVLIAHNTMVGLGFEAISLEDATVHNNSIIANNIFSNDGTNPLIALGTGTGVVFANNAWAGDAPPPGATGPGDVLASCALVDTTSTVPAGFKLANQPGGTPCHDAGKAFASVGVDFFGTARPIGAASDIGAHEAPPPPPPLLDAGPSADQGPAPDAGEDEDAGEEDDDDAGVDDARADDASADDAGADSEGDGVSCRCDVGSLDGAAGAAALLVGVLLLGCRRRRR